MSSRMSLHPMTTEFEPAHCLGLALRASYPDARLLSDSRMARAGDILVIRPGQQFGLETLLHRARAVSASAVIVDEALFTETQHLLQASDAPTSPVIYRLPNLSVAQGVAASAFYGEPSDVVRVTAVTGTNGKSSVAHGLAKAIARLAGLAATIGTLGTFVFRGESSAQSLDLEMTSALTSPDSVSLQFLLAQLRDRGVREVVLEASSIGLIQGRFAGCRIRAAAFTNLSVDHLDVHPTMQAYAQAKALLFEAPDLEQMVLSAPLLDEASSGQDQMEYLAVIESTARTAEVSRGVRRFSVIAQVESETQGTAPLGEADLRVHLLRMDEHGTQVSLSLGDERVSLMMSTWGAHNLQNVAVISGLLFLQGHSLERVAASLAAYAPPAGRLQRVACDRNGPLVLVDYAHTPDGLVHVLKALRPLANSRGGLLRVLFGCGGDRDRAKRPLMGARAAELSDRVVLTSDNPRSERPTDILDEISSGIPPERAHRVQVQPDRRAAIDLIIEQSAPQDVVVLAGKGHEKTQVIGGESLPFDDVECATEALLDWRPLMKLLDLEDLFGLQGEGPLGQAWEGARHVFVESISTDSRSIRAGAVFIALRGDRFDGHDFLKEAHRRGAAAAIVCGAVPEGLGDCLPLYRVTDTSSALARLAQAWRENWSGSLVGVAGSNGKTTTKEMVRRVFAEAVGERRTWATPGNHNNQIGVPQTLLGLRPRHHLAVIEVGMNHPGEILQLAQWSAPQGGVITNAQREHQEFMQSVEACAQENGDLLTAVEAGGFAIFPRDRAHEAIWTQKASHLARVRFGLAFDAAESRHDLGLCRDLVAHPSRDQQGRAVFQLEDLVHVDRWPLGQAPIPLAGLGAHVVRNAVCAAAVGLCLGLNSKAIRDGLSGFQPIAGRGRLHALPMGGLLVDDSYNANPDSVRAAIDALALQPGPRAMLLGDMGEVGEEGQRFHDEVLLWAHQQGIEQIWLLGSAMREASARVAVGDALDDVSDAAHQIQTWLGECAHRGETPTLWVKGSRFMRLERLLSPLLNGHSKDHAALSI